MAVRVSRKKQVLKKKTKSLQKRAALKKRKGTPSWATAPIEQFLDDAERIRHMVQLSSAGIQMIQNTPKVVEVLTRTETEVDRSQQLKLARENAKLAEREVKTGFPILHAWAVIGLWGLFEAMIRTLISEWLRHKRAVWQIDSIQKLKFKLGDYESIPRNQRHHFVVEMLERDLSVGIKSGVNRFEAILEPFNLSGEVPESVKHDIYEFGQVRNLIVHNASRVDRRFSDSCPWVGVSTGEELHVSYEMLEKYSQALIAYTVIIICRVGESFGVDMSAERKGIFQ